MWNGERVNVLDEAKSTALYYSGRVHDALRNIERVFICGELNGPHSKILEIDAMGNNSDYIDLADIPSLKAEDGSLVTRANDRRGIMRPGKLSEKLLAKYCQLRPTHSPKSFEVIRADRVPDAPPPPRSKEKIYPNWGGGSSVPQTPGARARKPDTAGLP
jgi:hypothetical protein